MGSIFRDADDSIEVKGQGSAAGAILGDRDRRRERLVELCDGDPGGEVEVEVEGPGPPNDLLGRWNGGPSGVDEAASLIASDFFQRLRSGDEPSVVDFKQRTFDRAESLAGLISHQTLFPSAGGDSSVGRPLLRLPDVGDEVFGFRLRHPLGRGAFARVFLAEQADLAGRPVVLKISAIEGTEPQTLAQLQHTHIVPIYSVHEDPRAGVRAVCMPYFGGASLSAVLKKLWEGPGPPSRGAQFVAALAAVRSPSLAELAAPAADDPPAPPPEPDPESPLGVVAGMSHEQAAAWLVAHLAEGLAHAHQRGILHRDVKPSNVLIGDDGRPMLLDFNLAHEQKSDPAHATLGGTVAYMAPEHLRALAGNSAALAEGVDARSDVYSLGMVLAEILTGHNPFDQSASYSVMPLQIEALALERGRTTPSLRSERPEIPWSLEGVARKCLAPDPSQRYRSAGDLAEDLRRFLDDRPLRYAPEPSRVETVQKFLRRHPGLRSTGTVAALAAVLVLCVGFVLAGVRRHLDATRTRLDEARARERLEAHVAGTAQAFCLVNTNLGTEDHLRKGAEVCEQTLGLYGAPDGPPLESHPDWAAMPGARRLRIAEDRRELLMLLAWARVRLGSGREAAAREALGLLGRAEAIRGLVASRALRLEKARYLDMIGETGRASAEREAAARTPATTAADHYLLATAHAREQTRDGFRRAVRELDRSLELNPKHYWSVMLRGICRAELGEMLLAAGDFGACTGLWPESAWGYFNRGYVLDREGRKAEAEADYSAALRRDPRFLAARLNRGLARLELRRYASALDDFRQAIGLGASDASVQAGLGIAFENLGRHAEADAAFKRAFERASALPASARARFGWSYGFAVSARLPAEARRAFEGVVELDRENSQAHYGLAVLDAGKGLSESALGHLDRVIKAEPSFVQARRLRAVLLARLGRWSRAIPEINVCLEREPGSPSTNYDAACVMALRAGATLDPSASEQAIELLRRASESGGLPGGVGDDPDLAALRDLPAFRAIARGSARRPGAGDPPRPPDAPSLSDDPRR